jgi:hypothetical protein
MDQSRWIPKETFSGKGEIRKEGTHFADCRYHLQFMQEIITTATLTSSQSIPGMLSYSGAVTLTQEQLLKPGILAGMESGAQFTLHLSDGQSFKVSFNKVLEINNPLNGVYKIIPAPG